MVHLDRHFETHRNSLSAVDEFDDGGSAGMRHWQWERAVHDEGQAYPNAYGRPSRSSLLTKTPSGRKGTRDHGGSYRIDADMIDRTRSEFIKI